MNVEDFIVPGKILFIDVCFPQDYDPQGKYFVFVGTKETPLLLKINTNKNFCKKFIKIKKSQYNFLKYDSFLDCSNTWYLLTYEEIRTQIEKNKNRVICDVIPDHKNQIIFLTDRSKSISNKNKRIIRDALS